MIALRQVCRASDAEKRNRGFTLLEMLLVTILTATLMAGIWGMNFETIPELKYWFGYPAALGLMATVGVGMLLFFRKTGWFD